ncbi:hypothetical protein D3C86_1882160 [compost metagenome]
MTRVNGQARSLSHNRLLLNWLKRSGVGFTVLGGMFSISVIDRLQLLGVSVLVANSVEQRLGASTVQAETAENIGVALNQIGLSEPSDNSP